MVTNNAMYFSQIHPERDRYVFGPGDTVVAFAQANNMRLRGHTLIWHNMLPSWVAEGKFTREDLAEILKSHITTIVGRYRGKIAEWDVVNEAIEKDGSLRDTFWRRNLGPDYIDQVFRWAHEADPDAALFYNDYDGEGLGVKSDGIYNLVKGMRERGVPIDGVGLQMHLRLEAPPNPKDVADNIRRLGALGLKVDITEMDVRVKLPATAEKLADQARVYSAILNASLSIPGFNALVLWGFTDRHTWITAKFPGYGAPLLFDEDYQSKPAHETMSKGLDRH